jgi:hypothetical protein
MPNEANALSGEPGASSQDHYQTSRAALSSAGGRAVPDENPQHSRQAVTRMLLTAIGRLEAEVATGSDAASRFGDELRQLLQAIRLARPKWGADSALAALLDLLERRIDTMVEAAKPEASIELAVAPTPDPLAAIKALSEEERIALFT